MASEPSLSRRSVGVRYWRLRDLPVIGAALVVAYLAHAIDKRRGESL